MNEPTALLRFFVVFVLLLSIVNSIALIELKNMFSRLVKMLAHVAEFIEDKTP